MIRNGRFCCICLIIFLCTIRDNCPPPQKAVQQPQPQHPAPPPFSPILPRSADGFSPRQHSTSVQQPQQQQQQQQQQPKSIGSHHYRSVPPAEPQYHQQRHADGSQSWNEWTQQLLVRFLPVLVLVVCFFCLVFVGFLLPLRYPSGGFRKGLHPEILLFIFCPQDQGGCSRFID